jgi:ATP-binding cassette subfamily F protein uup
MATPLLQLRDVGLVDGRRRLFEHVDLGLEPKARACLVGRNAAGKSTLLRILAGQTEPDEGGRLAASSLTIALVAQEPTVEAASLEQYAAGHGAPLHAAQAMLAVFGLDPAAPAQALSGGEARRAALAAAFAADPDVLLLDEPTNHLDILAIDILEERLARSRAAVLVVSHDRAFLERVTTSCFWLESRRVRSLEGGFARFEDWADKLADEEARSARRLDVAIAQDERWLARGVTARRARNEGRLRRLMALRAQKAEQLGQARGAIRPGVARGERSGRLVIEAVGVAKAFGERRLLAGFSTRIMRGDRVAIVGANGSGKTTLVRILLGEIAPDVGTIRPGVNVRFAYVDQLRGDLAPGTSVVEALTPAGGDQIMVGGAPRNVGAYARDFLFRDEQLRQPVESLSGGERNRLLLARILARPSNLLVLDEPTNDLDVETLDVLEAALSDYGGTVILVSHDRDFIDRLATSTVALDGRGGFVETPGGWSDFVRQNPGFLQVPNLDRPPTPARPVQARRQPSPSAKLSFGETRRLAELENQIASLPTRIVQIERRLADPDFYLRDAREFAALTSLLGEIKAALAAVEDEWLALEERRDRLAKSVP